jgi:hypothetical protein
MSSRMGGLEMYTEDIETIWKGLFVLLQKWGSWEVGLRRGDVVVVVSEEDFLLLYRRVL